VSSGESLGASGLPGVHENIVANVSVNTSVNSMVCSLKVIIYCCRFQKTDANIMLFVVKNRKKFRKKNLGV
jgi:hypothetical protein